ncbi:unnamed protein product [Didymodactylos carnosus]|uniref:Uncharacterized protein n=1 Tax=Didymodactylos carnosus TaxID=1234261 RepID=A0A815KLY1_9BILA|nr:unnamed protein product [Didymodactylos carnosus]CAF1391582.1 unnamed protein product [Didymodactylos carnosus]CAF3779663.1 unnamed protein product [Didymodactylos carnosus]CAF4286111.1 unnamed protein product [Didymodactylos carnosus]
MIELTTMHIHRYNGEFLPGVLGTSNIPNVATAGSILYDANGLKICKVSGIGKGKYVPYKNIDFENTMKITIPSADSIDSRISATATSSQRAIRKSNNIRVCPGDGCTASFETEEGLNIYIALNLHTQMNIKHALNDD